MDQGGILEGRAQLFQFDLDAQELLPADPRRIGVIFCYEAGGASTLVLHAYGGIQGDFYLALKPPPQDREYFFSRHGPLPSAAWRAEPGGNNVTLAVYELLVRS